jgi:hypothetical protein
MLEQDAQGWLAIWKFAINDPAPEKIEILLGQPQATLSRALRWVFITGMVVTVGLVFIPFMFGAILGEASFLQLMGLGVIGVLVILPLGGAVLTLSLLTLSFLLNLGTIHFFANVFGNDYSYRRLVYPMAAVICPFTLINLGLLYIPILGWMMLMVTTAYQLIVVILTIKGIYDCTWFHAILIGIIPPAILQVVFMCLYYVLILLLFAVAATNPTP